MHSPEDSGANVPAERPKWFLNSDPNAKGLWALRFLPAYFAGGTLLFFFLWTAVGVALSPDTPRLWLELLGHAIFATSAIVPAVVIARVEERPFGAYGLPATKAFRGSFWLGAAWAVVALSVLLGWLAVAGRLQVVLTLHGTRIAKFSVFWALFFLCVAFFEEFAFRGYVLYSLTRAMGFWPAAVISSICFGAIHAFNPGETWFGTIGAGAIGLFFCFTLRRTGNLWFAVGFHAFWDWAQTFFYGVPDSGVIEPGHLFRTYIEGTSWITGGSVGPEGSALLIPLIVLIWVLFDRLNPAKRPAVSTTNSEPCT